MSNRFYYGQQDYIVQLNLMDEAFLNSAGNALLKLGGTMTGAIVGYAGTAALPGLAIGTASNGLYAPAANQVAVSINGAGVATFTSTGLSLPGTLAVTGAASAGSLTLTTKLPVAQGGTGAATAAAALTNLGAAPTASPTFTGTVAIPTLALTNDLAIADGGTGASTAAAALTNLGAAPLAGATFTGAVSAPSLTLTTDLAITEGGTGASTAAQALTNLGAVDTNTFNSRVGTSGGLGFRNRIINGDCRIAQRAPLVIPGNSTAYGGPDRYIGFIGNGAGGGFTQAANFMTVAGVPYNTVRQTVNTPIVSTTGTSYWYGITQIIEGYNCHDLLGKPVTVSFYFNSSVAGTYTVAVRDQGGAHSCLYTFTVTANTVTRVEFTTPTIPVNYVLPEFSDAGLSITIGAIATGSLASNVSGAWVSGNYISAPTATNWATTTNNFIEVTLLQVEEGTKATVFERRSYGLEFLLCQRYLQSFKGDGSAGSYVSTGLNITSSTAFMLFPLVTPMRASPSFSVQGSVSDITLTTASTGTAVTSYGVIGTSSTHVTVSMTGTGSPYGAGGQPTLVRITTPNTTILLSSEL